MHCPTLQAVTRGGKGDAADGTLAAVGRVPPRQSSDSTLHPLPGGGRPSARSSFDSSASGASSEPSHSQRVSLDMSGSGCGGEGGSDSGSGTTDDAVPSAVPTAIPASDMGTGGRLQRRQSGSSLDLRRLEGTPSSPFGLAQPPFCSQAGPSPLGGPATRSLHLLPDSRPQRRSFGKHPSNLEHGSTAPPGAVDDVVELLLAAATQASAGAAAAAASAAGNATAAAAPIPGGAFAGAAAGGGFTAAARGAMPRRSVAPPHAGGQSTEPLLSSQVAMLAQQLLMQHQNQQPQPWHTSALATSVAAQLRRSLERQSWPPTQQPASGPCPPAARSLGPTAAELLLSRGASQVATPTASAALQALDPASQPRYSAPQPAEHAEQASPFSSIQGDEPSIACVGGR